MIYLKFLALNIIIVAILGFIQYYIILPPFYIHYHYYTIPILTAIILSIPPTVLEKRLKEYKKDIDRLKKRVFEIDKRNKDKNYEIIKIIKNSRYDALTKAMNKDFFNEIVGSKIVESKLYKHPLSIIMFDIDFFKKINDTYGHLVGDKVLSEVGNVVKKKYKKVRDFCKSRGRRVRNAFIRYFFRWGNIGC